MIHQTPIYHVNQKFEVEIERDESEEERRYQAWCRGLAGCYVHASTRAKALRKIKQAIGVWLELANRQMDGQETATADTIDMMSSD